MSEKKSLCVTYFLWLIGGIFGLHHIYLGRDRHAFVYWVTFGGFLFGWISDLWNIPSYVKDVNEDPEYMMYLTEKMRKYPKSPFSYWQSFSAVLFAEFLGIAALYCIPSSHLLKDHYPLVSILVPFAIATGVHTIGNIGRSKGKFSYPLIAAYSFYPLYFFDFNLSSWNPVFVQFIFERYAKEWRRQPREKKPFWRRMFILGLCGLLYLSMLCSGIYFNCSITNADSETIKCVDAAKHFFKSPIWKEFLSVVKDLWEYGKHHGWREIWQELLEAFDPQGYRNALKVFGIATLSSEKMLSQQYRSLSRQWHPDRFQDPVEKEEAQQKFIEIQQAYEILSKKKASRVAQNVKVCDPTTEKCDNT